MNLCILTFAFTAVVLLNFAVLAAETPTILCAVPFVKLLTNNCYELSGEITQ